MSVRRTTLRLRTVVFDLDDTLIASARARRRAFRALMPFGIDPKAAATVNDVWWPRYYRGDCSLDEMRVGRWVDLGLDAETARQVDTIYRGHHALSHARTGAHAMLRGLAAAGVKMVILSNASLDYVQERVATLGLERYLHGVVDVPSIKWKPHRDAFHAALEMAGGTPEEAAMVGDTLEADIEGALDAGFARVVWLTRRKAHEHPRVHTCASVAAAATYLLKAAGPAITADLE